jgi:hypothetical protein
VPPRLLENVFRRAVPATEAAEQLSEPMQDRACQHPWRYLSAASGYEREIEYLGCRCPTRRYEHTSYSRPTKTRLDEKAAGDLPGLRRAQGNRARTCARQEAQIHAGIRRPDQRRHVELCERRFVNAEKGFDERAPASTSLDRRERLR